MRRTMTKQDLALWGHPNRKQLGVRFRRQHPIAPYIVDFAAVTPRVVIEIDGATHENRDREALRDAELHELGWTVIHFSNWQIDERVPDVLDTITRAVTPKAARPKTHRFRPKPINPHLQNTRTRDD